jgi:SAM-dependent methyltransferase
MQEIQKINDASWAAALDSSREQFGNLEVNLRFLEQSGCVAPSKRVLELGCGTGAVVDWLGRQGCSAIGSDISNVAVEYGTRKYPGISLRVESAEKLPDADEQFDLVLSFDVLEHLFNVDAHLAEVYRVLRPGGCYLLQTPSKVSNALFETVRSRSFQWKQYHPSLHTPGQLKRRLAKHRFDVTFIKMNPVTPFFLAKLPQIRPLLWLVRRIPFTALPLCMQTNLFVIAQKKTTMEPPGTA